MSTRKFSLSIMRHYWPDMAEPSEVKRFHRTHYTRAAIQTGGRPGSIRVTYDNERVRHFSDVCEYVRLMPAYIRAEKRLGFRAAFVKDWAGHWILRDYTKRLKIRGRGTVYIDSTRISENFAHCAQCECFYPVEDVYDFNGKRYCSSGCASSARENYARGLRKSYGNTYPRNPVNGLVYGWELEALSPDPDTYADGVISAASLDNLEIKYDGSVGDAGAEFVTVDPLPPEQAADVLYKLCSGALAGWHGHSSRMAIGMHVHLNCAGTDPATLARIVYFVNRPANRQFIELLAGRVECSYAQFSPMPGLTACLEGPTSKYSWTHWHPNRASLEFRGFASNPENPDVMRLRFEALHEIVRYCQRAPYTSQGMGWQRFADRSDNTLVTKTALRIYGGE